MKKNTRFAIFFAIFLALIIYIDLPIKQEIKFNIGSKTVKTTISQPKISFSLFGKKIEKQFITHLGLDLKGGSHLVFEANLQNIKEADREEAITATRDTIERRVNLFGVSEPNVQTIKAGNGRRIVVDLPGIDNVSDAVGLIGATAQLDFREQGTASAAEATTTPLFLLMTKKTGLTGKHVKKSLVQFDQTGKPSVGLEFDATGAKLFEEITSRNVGKPVGIYLDEMPLSIPMVQQAITGGQAIITGDFSLDEAKKMSIAINSGALPVPIKLIEQRNIGPTLGAIQVQKSVVAGLIGLAAVILFMILYYKKLGVIAAVALVVYGLVSLALFKLIPVVLTLPGVAGFILSIGMAVDSNILIFERIKEEVRKGKSTSSAIQLGFGRAIDAIKDANLTTLLVAFILFNPLNWEFFPQFGLIRGFALTLTIGVLTSLFTGVFITKKLIEIFYHNK